MNALQPYPIHLINLQQRRCLVIGAGHEALGKIAGLVAVAAQVVVFAPLAECSPAAQTQLRQWAAAGQVVWHDHHPQADDFRGAFLVLAERSTPEQNAAIYAAGRAAGALVNVNDDLDHCDFIAAAIVRQGDLLLTISTSGVAPALAVRLKEKFAKGFGSEYALYLHWLRHLRQPLAQHYPRFSERKAIWYRLVDSDILRLLRGQAQQAAEQRLREIVGDAVWAAWCAALPKGQP